MNPAKTEVPQTTIQPGDTDQCAARRPGATTGLGAGRLPCRLNAGHDGPHRDAFLREWDGPVERAPDYCSHTDDNGDTAEGSACSRADGTDDDAERPAKPPERADTNHTEAEAQHTQGGQHMMSANGVPEPRDESTDFPTAAYDNLSDCLKEGDAERAWTYFIALDDWVRSGKPLPDPWRVGETEDSA